MWTTTVCKLNFFKGLILFSRAEIYTLKVIIKFLLLFKYKGRLKMDFNINMQSTTRMNLLYMKFQQIIN